jgi:biotin-dependent carboxylase-like uncharacterized protein
MIEIQNAGWYTSLQDLGRFGHQSLGVPISGAMDLNAFNWANALLNNDPNAACLEMTLKGATLKFHQATHIAITGAMMPALLNFNPVKMYEPIQINKGDVLQFSSTKEGCRTYLALLGGLQTETVLGSKSQYKGLTRQHQINKKSLIPFHEIPFRPKSAKIKKQLINYGDLKLEAFEGPEYQLLNTTSKNILKKKKFSISQNNNRMGYQLNEKISQPLPQIWTAPTLPGVVQLTPDGTLIILMRDAQVTGGYPRILQLSDDALNLLAQKSTRDQIKFEITSLP